MKTSGGRRSRQLLVSASHTAFDEGSGITPLCCKDLSRRPTKTLPLAYVLGVESNFHTGERWWSLPRERHGKWLVEWKWNAAVIFCDTREVEKSRFRKSHLLEYNYQTGLPDPVGGRSTRVSIDTYGRHRARAARCTLFVGQAPAQMAGDITSCRRIDITSCRLDNMSCILTVRSGRIRRQHRFWKREYGWTVRPGRPTHAPRNVLTTSPNSRVWESRRVGSFSWSSSVETTSRRSLAASSRSPASRLSCKS